MTCSRKAMNAVRTGTGNDVRPISSKETEETAGDPSDRNVVSVRSRRLLVDDDSLFPASASHIALMRPVELVVKYLAGNATAGRAFRVGRSLCRQW